MDHNVHPMVSQEALPMLDTQDQFFLEAWKLGADIIGLPYFAGPVNDPEDATHWRQLTPRLDAMRRNLVNRSQADAVFGGAMASFYNAQEGGKLMKRAGCDNFGSILALVTPTQRKILVELFASFQGW